MQSVQIDNFKGILDMRKINKTKNGRVSHLCILKKDVNVFESNRVYWNGLVIWKGSFDCQLIKLMFSGGCVGNRPTLKLKRSWIDSANCGFVRKYVFEPSLLDEPYIDGIPQIGWIFCRGLRRIFSYWYWGDGTLFRFSSCPSTLIFPCMLRTPLHNIG